jgi:predicted TIM-barrel fold metal-dependent hydrolase
MPRTAEIIDAHAHIFRRVRGANPAGPWRSSGHGCVETMQGPRRVMPAWSEATSFTASTLAALMDEAGIAKAVLLQNPSLGTVNAEIRKAVETFPDRFVGTVQVDPTSPGAVGAVRRWAKTPTQRILKFEMSDGWGWTGFYPDLRLNRPPMLRLWELAAELGLSVIIDTGPIGHPGYQIDAIREIADRFPDVTIVLEHLGYLMPEQAKDRDARAERRRLIGLARRTNIYLGFSAVGLLLDEDYPCPQSLRLLREAVRMVGARKILWGTDVPSALCQYTYRQMVRVVSHQADFLTPREKAQILGHNARRLFFRDAG